MMIIQILLQKVFENKEVIYEMFNECLQYQRLCYSHNLIPFFWAQ